jgi:hypothetical protein
MMHDLKMAYLFPEEYVPKENSYIVTLNIHQQQIDDSAGGYAEILLDV